jgi:putative ABC transport system substrate-binding protein
MKLDLIKKTVALALCVPMILTGCSSGTANQASSNTQTKKEEAKTYKIGISQLVEHPALDQARQGFIDEMGKLGVKIDVAYSNAQGDTANTQMIAEKFVKDKVDLIYSIATLSTQSAKKATEKTNIPVLFSSVTDPVYSQIVTSIDKIENVTGVTDKVEASEILKSAKELKSKNCSPTRFRVQM